MLGEQPPVVDLPAQDAQRRFQLVVRRFIGVFARPEHPLALFLDDLQWLDAATLNLLVDLLTAGDVRHLLLVGAYRDNEVSALHPLARKLDALRQSGAIICNVTLPSLAPDDLQQLIADALHTTQDRVLPLAELVQSKTGGQSILRHSISELIGRRGAARLRPWRGAMVTGSRTHACQGLHRQRRGPDGAETGPPANRNPTDRIRHFGFIANRRRATLLPLCFQLLGAVQPSQTELEASPAQEPSPLWLCPKCGGRMVVIERLTSAQIQLRSPPSHRSRRMIRKFRSPLLGASHHRRRGAPFLPSIKLSLSNLGSNSHPNPTHPTVNSSPSSRSLSHYPNTIQFA